MPEKFKIGDLIKITCEDKELHDIMGVVERYHNDAVVITISLTDDYIDKVWVCEDEAEFATSREEFLYNLYGSYVLNPESKNGPIIFRATSRKAMNFIMERFRRERKKSSLRSKRTRLRK